MGIHDRVSTGIAGFDRIIDMLRLGDNVVWQTESIADYKLVTAPFVRRAIADGRRIVYFRFGRHEPIVDLDLPIKVYKINAVNRFESFATEIYNTVESEGKRVFYVFDCLTDLLEAWHSDLMIGNFFKIICPFLYECDTIAYFALLRGAHTYGTIAGIRETTQLLLDTYRINERLYIHPLKVWKRYSPTMFFPHRIIGEEAISVTSSAETAELFSSINRSEKRVDYWDSIFEDARNCLRCSPNEQEEKKKLLMSMLVGTNSRMYSLCNKYMTLSDILAVASREVGSGFIGGKSVGMLIARKILEKECDTKFCSHLEPHDSFYLGSDIFYTYIVQNGWWELRAKLKDKKNYHKYAAELREKLLTGKFPEDIQEQFTHMLEYFGQSPIIVRSSSLLEDNFGNAFAGKYESVFCVNQGTPEERYQAFEEAVKAVYASAVNEDALIYRLNRGLFEKDEQMAILVQRVSGDNYNDVFFPHIAGVGNSSNLYVWNKNVDPDAGMLRLVFGLGTRAVDRTEGDYVRLIMLDDPKRQPPAAYDERGILTQNRADCLLINENKFGSRKIEELAEYDLSTDKTLFFTWDYGAAARLRELGYRNVKTPISTDFAGLIERTDFVQFMSEMLSVLSKAYEYPVDIEFTVNFAHKDRAKLKISKEDSEETLDYKVNLLQCRPLQTRGLGKPVKMPESKNKNDCFFASKGGFMGGNVHLPIEYVVFVKPSEYINLREVEKYEVARQIGQIGEALDGKNILLIGPGRWGTSTPSLGVPVNFSEICRVSVLCEYSAPELGFMPELSYGSHFFQDLVESEIFYAAIFSENRDVTFNPDYVLTKPNIIRDLLPDGIEPSMAIHVSHHSKLEIFSDIVTQKLICI